MLERGEGNKRTAVCVTGQSAVESLLSVVRRKMGILTGGLITPGGREVPSREGRNTDPRIVGDRTTRLGQANQEVWLATWRGGRDASSPGNSDGEGG